MRQQKIIYRRAISSMLSEKVIVALLRSNLPIFDCIIESPYAYLRIM